MNTLFDYTTTEGMEVTETLPLLSKITKLVLWSMTGNNLTLTFLIPNGFNWSTPTTIHNMQN